MANPPHDGRVVVLADEVGELLAGGVKASPALAGLGQLIHACRKPEPRAPGDGWRARVDPAVADAVTGGPLPVTLHPDQPPGVWVCWMAGVLVVGIYPDADHGTVYRWQHGLDSPPVAVRWHSPQTAPPGWPDCNREGA